MLGRARAKSRRATDERSIDSRETQRQGESLMGKGSGGSEQQRHSEVCLAMELHSLAMELHSSE